MSTDRQVPGLGLWAFWALGEDGWKAHMDSNLLLLSAVVQPRAINKVSTEPGSPTNGDIYLLDETNATHPNRIAIRDNGVWIYVTPQVGWICYDVAAGFYRLYNGTKWDVWSTGVGGASIATASDASITSPADGHILRYNGTTSKWENVLPQMRIGLNTPGVKPTAGQVFEIPMLAGDKLLTADVSRWTLKGDANAGATWALTIKLAGTSIATGTIASGASSGTYAMASDVTVAADGDILRFECPASQDATFTGLKALIVGRRKG